MKFSELSTGDVFIVVDRGVKYAKMGQNRALYYANNAGSYKEFDDSIPVIKMLDS